MFAVGVLLLAVFAVPSAATAAQAACSPNTSKYVVLQTAPHNSVFGTRGKIEWYNPDLCNPGASKSDSSAWAAVAADNLNAGGSSLYYAQTGYIKVGDNANYPVLPSGKMIFSEWTRKCQPTCTGLSSVAQAYHALPADRHAVMYTNVMRASDQRIHMLWDGVQIDVLGYNPTGDWAPAWFGEYGGEVEHPTSDVVGDVDDKVSINYLQKFDSAGNISFFPNPTALCQGSSCPASMPRFHGTIYDAAVGGKGLKIWTNPK